MAKIYIDSDVIDKKLDKLADGMAKVMDVYDTKKKEMVPTIVSTKTKLAQAGFTSLPIPAADRDKQLSCTETDGLFIRLNERTHRHTYNVRMKDGSEKKIGRVVLNSTGDRDGTKYLARARLEAKRQRGGADADIGVNGTLRFCYEYWRDAEPKTKGGVQREQKAPRTLAEGRKAVEEFAHDWQDRLIADITDEEILLRATKIKQTKFVSPVSGDLVGSRSVAENWLKTMSAIVGSTRTFHKTQNRFAIIKREHFPKASLKTKKKNKHRSLRPEEIALIMNLSRDQFRSASGRWIKGKGYPEPKLDVTAWRQVLAMKFQLLSGFRIGGVIGLRVDEINGVAIERPEADKTYTEHRLPLTDQLRAVIKEAKALKTGDDPESPEKWKVTHAACVDSPYLFCNEAGERYDANGSSSSTLFSKARDRLATTIPGCASWEDLPKFKSAVMTEEKVMTSHDLRVTVRTYARKLGYDAAIGAELIAHSTKSTMDEILYDDFDDEDERDRFEVLTEALEAIHNRFDQIAKKAQPKKQKPKLDLVKSA